MTSQLIECKQGILTFRGNSHRRLSIGLAGFSSSKIRLCDRNVNACTPGPAILQVGAERRVEGLEIEAVKGLRKEENRGDGVQEVVSVSWQWQTGELREDENARGETGDESTATTVYTCGALFSFKCSSGILFKKR